MRDEAMMGRAKVFGMANRAFTSLWDNLVDFAASEVARALEAAERCRALAVKERDEAREESAARGRLLDDHRKGCAWKARAEAGETEREALVKENALLTHKVICCGVAASHPNANLTRTGAYAAEWDSPQAERVRTLRAEKDNMARIAQQANDALGALLVSSGAEIARLRAVLLETHQGCAGWPEGKHAPECLAHEAGGAE
jgi:hypothetical protein